MAARLFADPNPKACDADKVAALTRLTGAISERPRFIVSAERRPRGLLRAKICDYLYDPGFAIARVISSSSEPYISGYLSTLYWSTASVVSNCWHSPCAMSVR